MSVELKDIVDAVSLIKPEDASQWESAGVPKLSAVRTLLNDKTITAAQLAEALKPATAPAAQVAASEPEVDISTLDKNSPEYATAVVKAARVEHAKTEALVAEQEAIRDTAVAKIAALRKADDVQINIIEQYGRKVSDAASVKAIQRQTQARLAGQKVSLQLVQAAVAGSGIIPAASKLDADYAARKRTPEQKQAMATFTHQTAQRVAQGGL